MLQRSLLALALTATLHSSLATPGVQLPELGDSASAYVSLQQEHDLGRLWLRQLRAHANVVDDPLAVQFLEKTIFRLAPYSEVRINDFEFVMVDQRDLNAFAVPGGIIGVNLGLFLYTRDEDEVSGVLAHELAHLSQRHFARQIEQADKQAPIALATLLASILLIATNNPDIGFAGLIGSQAASIQSQLAYSREWEREADRLGIKTLADAGLDPYAMPSMFQQMLKASRYQQRPPEFLLTHPVTESRVADAAGRAEQYQRQVRTSSLEFYLLQHLALIRYQLQGDQKLSYFKQLIDDNKTHPTQRAAALCSLAGLALEQQQPQEALGYLQSLAKEFSQHSAVIALQAQTQQALGQKAQAITLIEAALPFAPQDYLLLTSLASIYEQQNNFATAARIWRQLSEQRPTNPTVWRYLALNASKSTQETLALRAQAEFLFYTGQQPQALRQMELAIRQAKKEGDFRQEQALKQRQRTMASAPTKF